MQRQKVDMKVNNTISGAKQEVYKSYKNVVPYLH
jgi:hypothetical protein